MGQHISSKTYETELVALAQILQIFREEPNLDTLIKTTVDYLARQFNYPLIWIGIYNRPEHLLAGRGGLIAEDYHEFLSRKFILNPGDFLEQVVIQQRPIGIQDLTTEERAGDWCHLAQKIDIKGTLLFPLHCQQLCFGVAILGTNTKGMSPTAAEKAQLSLLLGGLAGAFHDSEIAGKLTTAKHCDQPLFRILEAVQEDTELDDRLQAIVAQTHDLIKPTRTNCYWYSQEKGYFWHRIGNKQIYRGLKPLKSSVAGVKVTSAPDFYELLNQEQLITVTSEQSPLSIETTEQLLSRLRTHCILAAPIREAGQLVGFLAVENDEIRIWEEVEKQYLQAATQILTLGKINEDIEQKIVENAQEPTLALDIAQILEHGEEWQMALNNALERMLQQFGLEHIAILEDGYYSNNESICQVFAQVNAPNETYLPTELPSLSHNDWQKNNILQSLIVVEDIETNPDLLVTWQPILNEIKVRSLLIYPLQNQHFQGLLVLCSTKPRIWDQNEKDIISLIAKNINLFLTIIEINQQKTTATFQYQTLATGLIHLWKAVADPNHFQEAAVNYLAQIIEAPIAIFLTWTEPDAQELRVNIQITPDSEFLLATDFNIPIRDPLIQAALASRGFYSCSVEELNPHSRRWLIPKSQIFEQINLGSIEIIALNTTRHAQAEGILIFINFEGESWSEPRLQITENLIRQFAWLLHSYNQGNAPISESSTHQVLSWYKHLCLEILHQSATDSMRGLLSIETQLRPHLDKEQSLKLMRQQQLMRQLEETMTILIPVLTEEKLQLTLHLTHVSLTNLIKRSLYLVESLYKQRKILIRVNNSGNFDIYCDPIKLECIIFELLVHACHRCPIGGNVELQSRIQHESSFTTLTSHPDLTQTSTPIEILIIEHQIQSSKPNREFLLHPYQTLSSYLVEPDSPNLKICQQVVRSFKGNLLFYQSPDGYYCTKLLLPT